MYNAHVYAYRRHMTLRSIQYFRKKAMGGLAGAMRRELVQVRALKGAPPPSIPEELRYD